MNRLLAVFIVLILCGFVTSTTGTTATNEFNPNYQLFPQGTVNGFYEAENYCQTLGGHLASIHDAITNDLVSDLLRQNGAIGYGWIGFNKITNSWTDNSLVDYTADFIPSVHDECTAIAIYDESNKWTQVPCTNPYAFACYIPPSKSSTCNHYWEYPVDICLYGDENNRKSSIFRCIDENTIEEKVYNGLTCNESNLMTTDTFECTPEMDCYCALNGIACQGFVGINTWCDSGSQSNFFGIVDTCQRNFEGGSNINYCNENGHLMTRYWLSDVNCDPLAPYTQDIYHTSCPNATRAVTCNLLQRNEQFTTENPLQFSHIGCFKDSESRALDDVDYGYGHSISECAQKCINYNYFSLQHDSYCFCENNIDDATRYGISDACINGLGGVWANDLYKQGITFNIVAWNEFHATGGYEGNFFGAYHSDIEQSDIANNDEIIVNGKTFIVNYFGQSNGQPETGPRIDYIYVNDLYGNWGNFKTEFGANGATISMIWFKKTDPVKSVHPTVSPIVPPTISPIVYPTRSPIVYPTISPIAHPTISPITHPTTSPIVYPTASPIAHPTVSPTPSPTLARKCEAISECADEEIISEIVYCTGHASCERSKIFANKVFIQGFASARGAKRITAEKIFCYGYAGAQYGEIYSDGISTMDAFFYGVGCSQFGNVYCSNGSVCNIYCDGKFGCQGLTINVDHESTININPSQCKLKENQNQLIDGVRCPKEIKLI